MKKAMFTDKMARESFIFSPPEKKDKRCSNNKIYSTPKINVKSVAKKQSLGLN